MKKLIIPFLAILTLYSCDKDDDMDDDQNPPVTDERRAIVVNEGNFGQGNAELGVWGLESNSYVHGLYESTNDEVLGDVLQSYYDAGDRVFWVVNNSGKVVATDRDGVKINEITELTSPRYFVPVSDEFAYVTDLFSGTIAVVNHQNYSVDHTIDIGEDASEEIFRVGDKVYVIASTVSDPVTFASDFVILTIDIATEEIVTTPVGFSISDADLDDSGLIWLAGRDESSNPVLSTFNVSSSVISPAVSSISGSSLSKVEVNDNTSNAYVLLDGDVYEVVSGGLTLLTDLDLGFGYGFRIDQETNEIYVLDAADFSSDGTAYRISDSGDILTQSSVGSIPRDIFIP